MSVQESKLKAIADAIREKEGSSGPIPANDFPARIRALPSGGLPEGLCTIAVEADPPEGGSVSGGGVASGGMVVTVAASAEGNYIFNGWVEDDLIVSNDFSYSFEVTADRTLKASFAASVLPPGYTQILYIQAENGAYVATGKKISVDMRLVIDAEPLQMTASYPRCEFIKASYARKSGSTYYYTGITARFTASSLYGYGIRVASQNDSSSAASTTVSSDYTLRRILLDWNYSEGYAVLDKEEPVSVTSVTAFKYYPEIYIGSYAGNETIVRVYSYKFYQNGEIVQDMVPCINPDGAAGMYDLVEKVFYPSANADAPFTPGPAV